MKSTFIGLLALIGLMLTPASKSWAADMGFRYQNGRCVNSSGQQGLNPGYIGQCGDLRNVILGRLNLDGTDFRGTLFTNADLQLSTFNGTNLTGASFEAANLAGVQFKNATFDSTVMREAILRNSQFGGATIRNCDFSESDFSGVNLSYVKFENSKFTRTIFTGANFEGTDFTGSDLSNTNFAQLSMRNVILTRTTLTNSNFESANLTEANLSGADATGASFKSAILANANLNGAILTRTNLRYAQLVGASLTEAHLENADLKSTNLENANLTNAHLNGALFNEKTTLPITKEVAMASGMIFKSKHDSVLIIWDVKTAALEALVAKLQAEGNEVVLTDTSEETYSGALLEDMGTVIHLNGPSYNTNMDTAGQAALLEFVKAGGTYVTLGWNAYEFSVRPQYLPDFVLFTYKAEEDIASFTMTKIAGLESHPLVQGLPTSSENDCAYTRGILRPLNPNPAQVIMTGPGGIPAVVVRTVGMGHVVDVAAAGNGNDGLRACLASPNIQKLILNAMHW